MKVATNAFCVKLPGELYYVRKGYVTQDIKRAKLWEHEEGAKAFGLGEVIPVAVRFTVVIEDFLARVTDYEVLQLRSNVPVS